MRVGTRHEDCLIRGVNQHQRALDTDEVEILERAELEALYYDEDARPYCEVQSQESSGVLPSNNENGIEKTHKVSTTKKNANKTTEAATAIENTWRAVRGSYGSHLLARSRLLSPAKMPIAKKRIQKR